MNHSYNIYTIQLGYDQFIDPNYEPSFSGEVIPFSSEHEFTGLYLESLSLNDTNRTLHHLQTIKHWLSTSTKDYALILEDTIDTTCSKNWSFALEDVVSRLPNDFKVAQLELIREDNQINSIMCVTRCSECWGAGAYLISRNYAEFLMLHLLKDDKFYLHVLDEPAVRPYVENVIFAPANDKAFNIPLFYIHTDRNFISSDSNIRSAIKVKQLLEKTPTLDSIFTNSIKKQNNNPVLSLDTCLALSKSRDTRAIIVDNFYDDPYQVREFALQQEFFDDEGYIGRRTRKQFLNDSLKSRFEELLNKKITKWEDYGMNGRFQHNWAGEKLVYHCDEQRYAAMIFLTPNAPFSTGTSTWAHKETKVHHNSHPDIMKCFNQRTFVDRTPYELVDNFGNVFNRLVIFDGGCIHSASEYFGDSLENCRLWHMFFFDAE